MSRQVSGRSHSSRMATQAVDPLSPTWVLRTTGDGPVVPSAYVIGTTVVQRLVGLYRTTFVSQDSIVASV